MVQTLQLKRGTSVEVSGITPAIGEPVYDREAPSLSIGDGSTIGGVRVTNPRFASYAALRAYTGNAPVVEVTGAGISGIFDRNVGPADNGGTQVGNYRRRYVGEIRVEWFGATGNGVTDDTLAITAALATGESILLDEKTYQISSGIVITQQGQRIVGSSLNSNIRATAGTYDIITFNLSGGTGCGIENVRIDATAMTGGFTIVVNRANLCVINNVRGIRGWSGIKVVQANTTIIQKTQMVLYRGDYLFLGDGTTARSDIVWASEVTLTCDETIARSSRPHGWTIDGNFNTIKCEGVLILQARSGIRHLNSAATTTGSFARYYDVEIEFCNEDAVFLDSGQDLHFTDCYMHGSVTGSGFVVGPNAGNISCKGGKITGHFKKGAEINGADVKFSGVLLGGNSLEGSALHSAVVCGATSRAVSFSSCKTGRNSALENTNSLHKYGFEVLSGAVDCNWSGGNLRGNVTGEWIDSSNGAYGNVKVVGYGGSTPDTNNSYVAVAVTAGGTTNVSNTAPTLFLNPAATIATYTVVMPDKPTDGMRVEVSTRAAITTLTVSPGSVGHTVNTPPTSLAAGAGFKYFWRASSNNWFRLY